MAQSLNFSALDFKDSNSSTIEQQMIIQCPQCQTKFAIEASALDGVDAPKFHCSRCDFLFSTDSTTKIKAAANKAAQQTLELSDDSESLTSESSSENSVAKNNLQPLRSQPNALSRELQIPKRIDSSFRAQAPLEREDTYQMNLNFGNVSVATPSASTESAPTNTSTIATPPNFTRNTPTALLARDETIEVGQLGVFKNTPLTDDPLPQISREAMKPAPQPTKQTTPSLPTEPRSWVSIASPILAFLVCLSLLTAYLRIDLTFAQEMRAALLPGAIVASPSSLFIRSAKIRKIELDSGETAHVISGALVNRSSQTFRDITLEGSLFDYDGKPTAIEKISSASSLAGSRIKSLTPEMIESLQQQRSSKKSILRPGDTQDFAIAFIGKEAAGARHFSVRVYSVKD